MTQAQPSGPRIATSLDAARPSGKTRGVVASAVILVAAVVIYFSVTPRAPRFDLEPHLALGRALAREALKLRQGTGRVMLITRDTEMFHSPAFEAQVRGFEQELLKAGVKVAASRSLKVNPLRVLAVPPGDFLELLRKGGDQDVIVSLLGPPMLDAGQIAKLTGNRPHVVAVCSGEMPRQVDLNAIFGQKLMDVAVISRIELPSSGGGANGFDRDFKIITAANLSELPTPVGLK